MYGTIGRYKFKEGMAEELLKRLADSQNGDTRPDGGVAVVAFRMDRDPDEIFVVAVSESEAHHRAASDSSEINAQYEMLAEHFAEEAQWNDGEVIMFDVFD